MGIRVSFYAVDVPRFETFIEAPLHELMWWLVDTVVEGDSRRMLHLYVGDYRDTLYHAIPRRGIVEEANFDGRQRYRNLTREESGEIALLRARARDCLERESSFVLKNVLRAFSHCPGVTFIRELSEGYRRWWIGSLLHCMQGQPHVTRADCDRLVSVLQKTLRGCDCGVELTERRYNRLEFDFPVIPANDEGLEFGVWTEFEAFFVARMLSDLIETEPNFTRPPGRVGIAPETNAEWNEWVYEMIKQLCRIRTLDFERLNVVTFIG